MPYVVINKKLYLSDIVSALDSEFISEHNIKVIINCTKEFPFVKDVPHHVDQYRIPVADNGDEDEIREMARILPISTSIISRAIEADQAVLVHCQAGRQRSVAVVLAYLMHKTGLKYGKVLRKLQKVRPEAGYPRLNFQAALDDYQRRLNAP